jgi:hypothetical protein
MLLYRATWFTWHTKIACITRSGLPVSRAQCHRPHSYEQLTPQYPRLYRQSVYETMINNYSLRVTATTDCIKSNGFKMKLNIKRTFGKRGEKLFLTFSFLREIQTTNVRQLAAEREDLTRDWRKLHNQTLNDSTPHQTLIGVSNPGRWEAWSMRHVWTNKEMSFDGEI